MELKDQIQKIYQVSKSYPELVKAFIQMGMLSYTVHVATRTILYRFSDGRHVIHEGDVRPVNPNEKFDKALTIQAVKDTQAGKTNYPEFMDAIIASGVQFYEVTLTGDNKRVTYIGVGGEYEEKIPF